MKKFKTEDPDSSCSEEEGWNGGLWMFRGTVHLERERLLAQQETLAAAAVTSEPLKGLVSYGDDDADTSEDEDGPPEEVKTVVSYDNDVPEEDVGEELDPNVCKKSRKRRKKPKASNELPSNNTSDVQKDESSKPLSAAEEALIDIKATIQSHIESFTSPAEKPSDPKDIEERNDVEEGRVDDIPDEPQSNEFVEESTPSSSLKAKQEVPVVFKKRLRHPTLLERLLLSEIKNERNTILQCVRYVCKNNFFLDNKEAGEK